MITANATTVNISNCLTKNLDERGALPHIKIWMKKSRIRLPYGKKKEVADGVEYASKKSGG